MNRLGLSFLYLLILLLAISCHKEDQIQLEEIVHERGTKGDISTRELQKLYKNLNILGKKLSGENEQFNADLQETLKSIEGLPLQLQQMVNQVETLEKTLSEEEPSEPSL